MEADPAFFDRFHREEEISESLDHPSLLKPIKDEHRSRDYFVTEWFDGQSLRERLNEKTKLPNESAIQITIEIADALEYIHGHGIIHRNLRPENILVGAGDRIKLIDFGVAAKEGSPRLTFTNLSQLLGGSPYISAEEVAGKRGDARSDLFALGMILYEMLTGKLPFAGDDPSERLKSYPIPPTKLEPSISPQLEEIICHALEREHRNRYATAHEFANDLRHPEHVKLTQRIALSEWKNGKSQNAKKAALYAALILIPIALFVLLIYFSKH
jgi:serine/threonine-protein kinase